MTSMAAGEITTVAKASATPYQLDQSQTTQACKVLLKHISEERQRREAGTAKPNLLTQDADSSEDEQPEDEQTPIWLILTTKKHIVDQKRLKPNKMYLKPYTQSYRRVGTNITDHSHTPSIPHQIQQSASSPPIQPAPTLPSSPTPASPRAYAPASLRHSPSPILKSNTRRSRHAALSSPHTTSSSLTTA